MDRKIDRRPLQSNLHLCDHWRIRFTPLLIRTNQSTPLHKPQGTSYVRLFEYMFTGGYQKARMITANRLDTASWLKRAEYLGVNAACLVEHYYVRSEHSKACAWRHKKVIERNVIVDWLRCDGRYRAVQNHACYWMHSGCHGARVAYCMRRRSSQLKRM